MKTLFSGQGLCIIYGLLNATDSNLTMCIALNDRIVMNNELESYGRVIGTLLACLWRD
jgi:hypothetical protein